MFRSVCYRLVWCVLVLSCVASAFEKGEALQITLSNGKVVKGTLLNETSNGFLIKTATGAQMVNYGDVANITQGAGASSAPQVAPTQPAAPQPQGASPPPPPQRQPRYPSAPSVSDFASRVSIVSRNDRQHWEVEFAGRTCDTPCVVDVEPGSYRVVATGPGLIDKSVLVPSGESTLLLQSRSGVFVVGLVTTLVGLAGAVVGLIVSDASSGPAMLIAGIVILGISAGVALIGTIMMLAAPKANVTVKRMPHRYSELQPEPLDENGFRLAWGR